jgi:hypothetical protein
MYTVHYCYLWFASDIIPRLVNCEHVTSIARMAMTTATFVSRNSTATLGSHEWFRWDTSGNKPDPML